MGTERERDRDRDRERKERACFNMWNHATAIGPVNGMPPRSFAALRAMVWTTCSSDTAEALACRPKPEKKHTTTTASAQILLAKAHFCDRQGTQIAGFPGASPWDLPRCWWSWRAQPAGPLEGFFEDSGFGVRFEAGIVLFWVQGFRVQITGL